MHLRRLVLTLLLVLPTFAPAQKRLITEKDIFSFNWIGDTQLSPDGRTVVFVQASVTPDHSGYQTALYTLDLSLPKPTPQLLTPGTHDTSPRWSPDSRHIAFTRAVERDGKPSPPQLYLIDFAPNSSSLKLTDLAKGASSPIWRPDGSGLIVLSDTPQDQKKAKLEAARKARATGDDAHTSDVRIINRAIYRANGEGYLDPSFVPQIYLISLVQHDGTQPPPVQLTEGRFAANDPIFAGSDWLLYSSVREEEPIYDVLPHNSLYAVALPASSTSTPPPSTPPSTPSSSLVADLKIEASGIALSPDRKHLAFHSSDSPKPISHTQTDLFLLDLDWGSGKPLATSAPRNLTGKGAYEMGSGVGGDNTAPRGGGRPSITWDQSSDRVLDIAGKEGSALLVAVDTITGKVTEETAQKRAVLNFTTTPDQSKTIALISNPIMIGDLFSISSNQAQTQLTAINKTLFDQLNLTLPLDIEVKPTVHAAAIHEHPIETFIQLPPQVSADSKPHLPLILNIHGGPHGAYGWVFDHEMQWMAAKGYVVVYPNPRGSTTYGENFANIIMNNYPGDDFHDLMDTVDAAIKLGLADPARLGVTGGSGGGLLTDWTVTQTNRFKAAVAQRDITDWTALWYNSDFTAFHQNIMPSAAPFNNLDLYRAKSPITFVNNIKTPMMFILGDADYRTPPTGGGEQFFRALKYNCIPTVMVRFPRESHELSRSGEPWHRVERLENIVDWFDKYLLNQPEPQYDIAPGAPETCIKP